MSVDPIPPGFNTVNVYLIVKNVQEAMDFYEKAFGGKGGVCMHAPDGSVMHAEVQIGSSIVMLSEENESWGMKSAESFGGSPAGMHLYVEDVDATFNQAIAAGGTEISPVENQFWGDRMGKLADPFGYQWGIASHVEDVDEAEMKKRGEAWFEEFSKSQQ